MRGLSLPAAVEVVAAPSGAWDMLAWQQGDVLLYFRVRGRTYDKSALRRFWRALQTGEVRIVDADGNPVPPAVFGASGRLLLDSADPDAGTLQTVKNNQVGLVYPNPRIVAAPASDRQPAPKQKPARHRIKKQYPRDRFADWLTDTYPNGVIPPGHGDKQLARDFKNKSGETISERTIRRVRTGE